MVVASFAEAWIEIVSVSPISRLGSVASFAEAWIEIEAFVSDFKTFLSPPSRRRGLKYPDGCFSVRHFRRLLRGGVD